MENYWPDLVPIYWLYKRPRQILVDPHTSPTQPKRTPYPHRSRPSERSTGERRSGWRSGNSERGSGERSRSSDTSSSEKKQ